MATRNSWGAGGPETEKHSGKNEGQMETAGELGVL